MRAETSRELESRVETGFSFQESGLNWGRALGKSARGAKWPAVQATVNFIGGS